ncbi:MAG: alpha/beta hydrolase [Robiginitomaculum sp.]|nr:alpha/beta hydrolase [Robiginitomaculum sp.]MDQ7077980.1 alpha/beta hydrolase [Robiginitomaculum sp.]
MSFIRACITILLFAIGFAMTVNIAGAQAGTLYTTFPKSIKPAEKYVFYSHGLIVEGTNETPVHPRFGTYDFPAIKAALSASDFNLIAYHRPAGTEPNAWADKLAGDVHVLIAAGVPAHNITLMGFSRGGMITALASSMLSMPGLNTILMASCGGWINARPDIKLAGRVLSIYETSDRFGTCQPLIDHSKAVTTFTEIAISTGKEHGAFFTPRKEWVEPVLRWINGEKQ